VPALLLAVILALGTTAHGQEPPTRRSLAGRLLVATDVLRDPRFARTVIYVVRHNADGAFGLVVNLPLTDVPYERALRPFGLEVPAESGDVRVHYGGPVEERRGFVLHTPDWKGEGTTVVDDHFALTEDPKVLQAMAKGAGPRRALFMLGYAGWAPGQLDAEMKTGAWGVAPADERLVFDEDPKQKWIEAMSRRILDL
jgi:putative transcriptional regulator